MPLIPDEHDKKAEEVLARSKVTIPFSTYAKLVADQRELRRLHELEKQQRPDEEAIHTLRVASMLDPRL